MEVVAATINALLDQAPDDNDPDNAPFEDSDTPRLNPHFIAGGPGHLGQIRAVFRGRATTCSIPVTR